MFKKLFFISVICVMAFISTSPNHTAQAEEVSKPTILPFAHIQDTPLSLIMSGNEAGNSGQTATQSWRFELDVTEEILSELKAAKAAGGTARIVFWTLTDIQIEGSGYVESAFQYKVILEGPDDNVTLHAKKEGSKLTTSSTQRTELYLFELDEGVISQFTVGDTLVVHAQVQARIGYDVWIEDQDLYFSVITKPVDQSTPPLSLLISYFPADNDLASQ